MVDIEEITIGLIVDKVLEVISIPEEEIVPPPDPSTGFQTRYIKGLGKVGNQVKLLLDCKKLLNDDEVKNLAELA